MPMALDKRFPTSGLAPAISRGTSVNGSLAAIVKHSELVVQIEHRIAEPVVVSPTGGKSDPDRGRQRPVPPARLRTPGTTDGRFVASGEQAAPALSAPCRSRDPSEVTPVPALTTGLASGRSRVSAPRRWSTGRPSTRRTEPGRGPG